jgi:hypothetical protein
MKSNFDSFHSMYTDLPSIGWAMVLGHAPAQVTSLVPKAASVVTVHELVDEGTRRSRPRKPHVTPAIERAPGNRAAPKIAPGKKRRTSANAKGARRR